MMSAVVPSGPASGRSATSPTIVMSHPPRPVGSKLTAACKTGVLELGIEKYDAASATDPKASLAVWKKENACTETGLISNRKAVATAIARRVFSVAFRKGE